MPVVGGRKGSVYGRIAGYGVNLNETGKEYQRKVDKRKRHGGKVKSPPLIIAPVDFSMKSLVKLFPGTRTGRGRPPLGIVVGSLGGKGLFAPGLGLLAHADKVWADH